MKINDYNEAMIINDYNEAMIINDYKRGNDNQRLTRAYHGPENPGGIILTDKNSSIVN